MDFDYEKMKEKLAGFDLQTKAKLIALAGQLHARKVLDELQEKEIETLENTYSKIIEPGIVAQNDIVSGVRSPTEEELTQLASVTKQGEKLDKDNKEPFENYWTKVLQNSKTISGFLGDRDKPILNSLRRVERKREGDGDDFGLIFTFAPNEHFTNEKIEIDFIMDKEKNEPLKITSTVIEWNAGKNVTVKVIKKKKKGVTKKKEVEQESLFTVFRNIDTSDEKFKALKEEELQEAQYKLEMSTEICQMIFDEIVPYSLEYYLDVHVEEDAEQEDMESDDEDDDEDLTKEDAIRRMKKLRSGGKK